MYNLLSIISFKNIFLALIWLSFFFSINLNPSKLESFNFIEKLRFFLPFCLFVIYIFVNFKSFKNIKLINILNLPFILIIILYIFFNLKNPENNITNLFWPIYMFLSFLFISCFKENFERKLLLKFTFLIIGLALCFYLSAAILQMVENKNFMFYGVTGGEESYYGLTTAPRSSGLARFSLLVSIFLIVFYFSENKKNNYFLLIMITISSFFVIIFQSRTIAFIFYFFLILNITLNFKDFFYDKKLIIFCLIFPLILATSYNFTVTKIEDKHSQLDNPALYIIKDTILRDQHTDLKNKETDIQKKFNRFSSERFFHWNKGIDIIKDNFLVGYGAQADRLLINQSIHNALLYAGLSGGIIASICIIVIYILSIYFFAKFKLFSNKTYNKSFEINLAINVLVVLNLRSLLETSFAVFSIDYLIFIIAYLYLGNHLINEKKFK